MRSDRSVVERQMERVELRPFTLEGFHRRRERKQRTRRVVTAVVALAVAAVAIGGLVRAFSSSSVPASDPASPFLGTWVGIDNGGTQTMTIRLSEEGAVRVVVHDDGYVGGELSADVCGGAPLTIIGIGRFQGTTELVIPSPVLTCDDGSDLEPFSPPVEEVLRNLTFVHHPEYDTLTSPVDDSVDDVVWERGPAAATVSGGMWPQTTLEKVQEAQRLADAGDPRYTWQVFPEGPPNPRMDEFFARFLREELGWEEFSWAEFVGLYAGVPGDLPWAFVAVRCAPGQTNPLYPNDPEGRECAPTIDEYRYETVLIGAEPPFPDAPFAIWVVSRWVMLQPSDVRVTGINYRADSGPIVRRQVQQVVPPSDAEATALLESFLQARVDGEGAEEYLSPAGSQIPLLYATTSDDPYERSEFELVEGPVWPGGWREFTVRLFAAGGSTVVEQTFLVERDQDGRLVLVYGALDPFDDVLTTENGGALAEPYEFLDGEVTFDAAPPWDWYVGGWGFTPTMTTLQFDDPDQSAGFGQLLAVVADPLPVESGCRQGPAPADAEALARSIRSDPDLEATEPVAVSVGGIAGLQMDVVATPGASVCEEAPQVVTPNDRDSRGAGLEHGKRMRLYLLDLPEGLSARILAIAISAPEPDFEHVMEAAEPIVNSFEFQTR